MAWYSILPPNLIYVESWFAHFFLILGIITIFPWAVLLIFDVSLYLWRTVGYELPVVGGRARGMQRPRAPSLNERPDGQRRAFGLAGYEDISTATKLDVTEAEGSARRRTPTDDRKEG